MLPRLRESKLEIGSWFVTVQRNFPNEAGQSKVDIAPCQPTGGIFWGGPVRGLSRAIAVASPGKGSLPPLRPRPEPARWLQPALEP